MGRPTWGFSTQITQDPRVSSIGKGLFFPVSFSYKAVLTSRLGVAEVAGFVVLIGW